MCLWQFQCFYFLRKVVRTVEPLITGLVLSDPRFIRSETSHESRISADGLYYAQGCT